MSAKPAGNDHPLREDATKRASNASIDSSAMRHHRTQQNGNDQPSLLFENEKLRREVSELRRQLSISLRKEPMDRTPLPPAASESSNTRNNLSHTRREKDRSSTKVNVPTVVLEMPAKIRSKSESSNNVKDHQSVSTADERETVEPRIFIESHQSAAGLHQRSLHNVSKSPTTTIGSSKMSPLKARAAELFMDDEYSSSSKSSYDEEDPLADSQHLIDRDSPERKPLNRNRQNEGIIQGRTTDESNPNPHQQMSFLQSLTDRAGWLIGLLIFQSLSSFILARNESLLQKHPVIVQFLTMLVGAGGNAGNQASVGVVRGIAIGAVNRSNYKRVLIRECTMGLALSLILGLAGFVRAKVFSVPWMETIAITSSLFMIVIISVIVGASLPMAMKTVGIDPAHSSTTIQVIMDISGVVITVHMSALMLGSLLIDDGEMR